MNYLPVRNPIANRFPQPLLLALAFNPQAT